VEPQEDTYPAEEKKLTKNNFKKRVQISNWRNSDQDKENGSFKTCKAYEYLTKHCNCTNALPVKNDCMSTAQFSSKSSLVVYIINVRKILKKHEKIRWK